MGALVLLKCFQVTYWHPKIASKHSCARAMCTELPAKQVDKTCVETFPLLQTRECEFWASRLRKYAQCRSGSVFAAEQFKESPLVRSDRQLSLQCCKPPNHVNTTASWRKPQPPSKSAHAFLRTTLTSMRIIKHTYTHRDTDPTAAWWGGTQLRTGLGCSCRVHRAMRAALADRARRAAAALKAPRPSSEPLGEDRRSRQATTPRHMSSSQHQS